jgi:hypothetical protein
MDARGRQRLRPASQPIAARPEVFDSASKEVNLGPRHRQRPGSIPRIPARPWVEAFLHTPRKVGQTSSQSGRPASAVVVESPTPGGRASPLFALRSSLFALRSSLFPLLPRYLGSRGRSPSPFSSLRSPAPCSPPPAPSSPPAPVFRLAGTLALPVGSGCEWSARRPWPTQARRRCPDSP